LEGTFCFLAGPYQINGNANLSLCHVLPYGNIICKYFYVWYVTRDWAAHVKHSNCRIGLWVLYLGGGSTCQCVKSCTPGSPDSVACFIVATKSNKALSKDRERERERERAFIY